MSPEPRRRRRPRPLASRPRRWAWPAAGHPIWPIARVVISTTALTAFLYVNATSFDQTEGRSIVGMITVNLLLEAFGLRRKT